MLASLKPPPDSLIPWRYQQYILRAGVTVIALVSCYITFVLLVFLGIGTVFQTNSYLPINPTALLLFFVFMLVPILCGLGLADMFADKKHTAGLFFTSGLIGTCFLFLAVNEFAPGHPWGDAHSALVCFLGGMLYAALGAWLQDRAPTPKETDDTPREPVPPMTPPRIRIID